MLRVGLTGGLGSGKTTVARLFSDLGVHILEADRIGRELMQPGQPVYAAIVEHFGESILQPPGSPRAELDRAALARIVFGTGPGTDSAPSRLQELNRIVHPAVIAEQERRIEALALTDPGGIAMVESALIFEVERDATESPNSNHPAWHRRFDKIILVTAPEPLKIARFVARALSDRAAFSRPADKPRIVALEQDARNRLAAQIPDAEKLTRCDYIIDNSGTLAEVAASVRRIHADLAAYAQSLQ